MSYTTLGELFYALLASIPLGALLSLIYLLLCSLVAFFSVRIKEMIRLAFVAENVALKDFFRKVPGTNVETKWMMEWINFIFIIFSGVAYSVFCYISMNGTVRIFPLISGLISYIFTVKAIGRPFKWIFEHFLSFLVCFFLYPICFIRLKIICRLRNKRVKEK